MITHFNGMELRRSTVLSMLAADAADRREQRAREEAGQARYEELVARAEAYHREHGEWEWQTRTREAELAARAEARAEEQRQAERREQHESYMSALLMGGHRPRSIGEVLAAAAGVPWD